MAAEKKLQCEVHDAGYSSYVSLATPASTAEDARDFLVAVESDPDQSGTMNLCKHCNCRPTSDDGEGKGKSQFGDVARLFLSDRSLMLSLLVQNATVLKRLAESSEKASEASEAPSADACQLSGDAPVPEPAEAGKDGTDATTVTNDKLRIHCQDLWDVLPRLLKIVEVMSKHADSTTTKPVPRSAKPPEPIDENPRAMLGYDSFASVPSPDSTSWEEFRLGLSRSTFLTKLTDTERQLGIRNNRAPKKVKGKVESSKGGFLTRQVYDEVKSVFVVIFLAVMVWQLSFLNDRGSRRGFW